MVGMESSSPDMPSVLLTIFKTKSSVTGSKISKGLTVKDILEQAAGFGGGCLFLMAQIIPVKY